MANQDQHSSPIAPIVIAFLGLLLIFAVLIWPAIDLKDNRTSDQDRKQAEERLATLKRVKREQREATSSYLWANKEKGIARVPLTRATKLTLEDLQKKKVQQAGPTNPVTATKPNGSTNVLPGTSNKPSAGGGTRP